MTSPQASNFHKHSENQNFPGPPAPFLHYPPPYQFSNFSSLETFCQDSPYGIWKKTSYDNIDPTRPSPALLKACPHVTHIQTFLPNMNSLVHAELIPGPSSDPLFTRAFHLAIDPRVDLAAHNSVSGSPGQRAIILAKMDPPGLAVSWSPLQNLNCESNVMCLETRVIDQDFTAIACPTKRHFLLAHVCATFSRAPVNSILLLRFFDIDPSSSTKIYYPLQLSVEIPRHMCVEAKLLLHRGPYFMPDSLHLEAKPLRLPDPFPALSPPEIFNLSPPEANKVNQQLKQMSFAHKVPRKGSKKKPIFK